MVLRAAPFVQEACEVVAILAVSSTREAKMSDLSGDPSRMLSNLERATVPKEFFLLAAFTLLIDLTVDRLHGNGLIFYAQHPDAVRYSFLLEVFLIFVAYSFLTSLIAPLVSHFVTSFLLEVASPLWDRLRAAIGSSEPAESTRPSHEYVLLGQLSNKVHRTCDTGYYAKLLEKEQGIESEREDEARSHRLFASAAFFACAADLLFGNANSLFNIGVGYAGWTAALMWTALALSAVNAFGFVFQDYRPRWVYCPTLAEELAPKDPPAYLRGLPPAH